jgi:nicotinamidase-related amidase
MIQRQESAQLAGNSFHTVLIVIDFVNDLEFEGGEALLPQALMAARACAALKAGAKRARMPVIYANDNFGQWRSDFRQVIEHCLGDVRGRPIIELLRPQPDDYFVLNLSIRRFSAHRLAYCWII